jgi:hypothetical protein
VGALVLVLAAGTATTWWLTREEDNSPLAGRPRVEDTKAGLSYGIPEGWKRNDGEKLIDAFTSMLVRKPTPGSGDEEASTVLAGRGQGVPREALKEKAELYARSNAEFFYPDGSSTPKESRQTTVSGRPAHTVTLNVRNGEGGTGQLRFTLVRLGESRSAFIMGVANTADPAQRREVAAVLKSASKL